MSEFLTDGKSVVPKPLGLDYDLEAGRIYRLKTKRSFMSKVTTLEMDGNIKLPEKIHKSESEDLFIKRALKYHNETTNNTTGVMLYGKQGCGKTLFSKELAKESNLPIIIVDPTFDTRELLDFFTKFTTPVAILFDELDKHCGKDDYWETKEFLEFLDGVQETCKKLVIFTCNNDDIVNDFLKNRCGRIRYYKYFGALTSKQIKDVVTVTLNDVDKVEHVSTVIENEVKLPSYDNVLSICKEINDWPSYDIKDLLKDLNVDIK